MLDTETTVYVHEFEARWEYDFDADISWLDQTDEEMGEGFEEHAERRKATYGDDWFMVGLVVEATLRVGRRPGWSQEFKINSSLWGIESDADALYFRTLLGELCDELSTDLDALGVAERPVTDDLALALP
ncbi:MAG: hypothetical protein AAGA99_00600 [Actinomycetota bacterium]